MKLFKSIFAGFNTNFEGDNIQSPQRFATAMESLGGKYMLDTAPKWLASVATGLSLDAVVGTKRVLPITGHSILVHDVLRFTTGPNAYIEAQVQAVKANFVLLATELPNIPTASDGFSQLRPLTPTVDLNGNLFTVAGQTTIIDFLDNESMVPTGANAIPASGAAPLEVVNSLAQSCTKIQVISDVGEFINLYLDAAGATLIAHIVLTPDEIVDVDIPAGSTVYIRAAKNVAIDDVNSIISMNFIG